MNLFITVAVLIFSCVLPLFVTYLIKRMENGEKITVKDIKIRDVFVALLYPLASLIILFCAVREVSTAVFSHTSNALIYLFITLAISFLQLIFRFSKRKSASFVTFLLSSLLFSIVLSLTLEICLFNSRALQSAHYESLDLKSQITAENENSASIIFEIPDIQIKNIYIKYENKEISQANIGFMFVDESNELFTDAYYRTVYASTPASSYIPINLLGNSNALRVIFQKTINELDISAISANTPRPLDFSVSRFIMLTLVCFFFLTIREKTFKNEPLDLKKPRHFVSALICVLFCCFAIAKLITDNDFFLHNLASHHSQLQSLAKAFCRGELFLPDEVPQFLIDMENPYDTAYRNHLAVQNNQTYHWDAAYFNGHYYVYFGVIPVILLYLPYYLITGKDLPNGVAVLIFAMLLIVSLFFLIYALIRRYSKSSSISLGEYLLLSLTVTFGSGIVFLGCYPDMYAVPIISGLAFSALGLALWIFSYKFEENAPKRFCACITIGSLLLALSVGCRPQFALISFLAIPIFWNSVFKKRSLFSKKGAISTVLFALPYVLVAVGLMWYNFARFGSPFDFGASYNLTTNDVSNRGFVYDRLGTGLFYYLIQPYVIDPIYPFLKTSYIMTSYMGVTIRQDIYGGVIFQSPLIMAILCMFFVKNDMKKARSFYPAVLLTAIGLITVVVDFQMGGIIQRYVCDFALIFTLAAVLVYIAIKDKLKTARIGHSASYGALTLIFTLTAVFALLFSFTARPIGLIYSSLFWL